eukprot:3179998-Alexandrium_andersonii.AAC.1
MQGRRAGCCGAAEGHLPTGASAGGHRGLPRGQPLTGYIRGRPRGGPWRPDKTRSKRKAWA